jgi:hypothetical protein
MELKEIAWAWPRFVFQHTKMWRACVSRVQNLCEQSKELV